MGTDNVIAFIFISFVVAGHLGLVHLKVFLGE